MEGLQLDDDWIVIDRIRHASHATGGFFSSGYRVENQDGRKAFLKAIDFFEAEQQPDPARALQPLIETFNFERDLLDRCSSRSLDRVVRYITDGKVMIEGRPVQYLIFELADRDIRSEIDLLARLELAWELRVLHHISVGLKQLHSLGIAHQDLKPSNVLSFDGTVFKVGDLGRSAHQDYSPPHDNEDNPGDYSYAPPELLYGLVLPDWKHRRFGADLYLLGSMTVFMFTRASMTSLVQAQLATEHRWGVWGGTFQEAMPYLREAFERVIQEIGLEIPLEIREDLIRIIRQLCNPDPAFRGHPRNRAVPYDLERYVNELNILARKAEMRLF